MRKLFLITLLSLAFPGWSAVYQEPAEYLKEVFPNGPPEPKVIWISKKIRPQVEQILAHSAGFLRTRYWRRDNRSAFILEEIGKTEPITVGVVVNQGKIEQLKVLAFRESRGWEVKHDFFTDQFKQAGLTDQLELDHPIDGISGATLSVRALEKIARLALFFEKTIAAH